jgi:hypothetical protein
MLFSWVDALRQGAANAMIMTMYALLAQAQCLDRSGTARSTQVSTRRRKSGAGVALCDMLRDVETLRIDLSPFQRFVDVERSGLRHKLLALTRVLRDDEVIDVLSRCAELRAACAAPPLDGAGEASRLWEPEYVSFGAGAAYATMRSQALLFKVPYSSSKVAHCQSKALVELWQRLLRPGTPEQAVLLRVYCKTYERVHQLGPAAGMSTVDAQRARAATAEAQAARKAAATGGVPRLSRIAQAVEFGPGRQLGPAFDEAGASCSVDATAARDADSLYDGQITDGDIALAYVEAEMRLAAGGELSTFPSAAGLEGVLNKQQMRALDQARRVEVVGGALFTLATEVGTRTHAFLEQCVGGARARVQNNVHMTVDRRACRAAVCALLFALCRATRSGMLGMLPLAFGVAFFSDRLRGSLKPLSRWIGLTVGAPTVWTHLKLLAQVVMLTSYFYVSGWHGIVIALDNFNQFHHFGASRLANHNNLAFGGPSISCCMTVIMEEMAAWFVLGAYGFTATPLGNVRAADAIIDSSGKARHSLFELLAELHIGPGDVGGCAAPPRQAGASGAPPPRPSRTRLMLRVLLERCRFGETRWFGALPAGRRPVKAGGELDQTAANGGRLPNNVIRQRVITWPLRPFDMARRLDVIRATAEILSMLHIGSAGEFKTALVVGDFIIWQHMLSGLMMTVAQAAVLSEQSAAAHGVLPGLEPRFGARTDPLAAVAPAAAAPAAAHAEAPDELVPPSQWAPLVQLRIGDVRTVVELERLLREYGVGTNLTVKVRKNVLRQLATNWGLNEPLAAGKQRARASERACALPASHIPSRITPSAPPLVATRAQSWRLLAAPVVRAASTRCRVLPTRPMRSCRSRSR